MTSDYPFNRPRRLHVLIACSFAARAAVEQPCVSVVELVGVPLEVLSSRLDPAAGIDRAADDHSVEAFRARVVGTGGDDDVDAEGFELTPNGLCDLLRRTHFACVGHEHPRAPCHCASFVQSTSIRFSVKCVRYRHTRVQSPGLSGQRGRCPSTYSQPAYSMP